MIVCIGVETITYEEKMSEEELKKYKDVFEEFNIPLEKAKKFEFDWIDYKYVFRVPIDRNMEIENYKMYKDSVVVKLRRKGGRGG
jgi:phage FluMu gp28-like protein